MGPSCAREDGTRSKVLLCRFAARVKEKRFERYFRRGQEVRGRRSMHRR